MRTQKGITLMALIITIIVMLILLGVSVSVALNTGLFKNAQGAARNTEAEKLREQEISAGKITIQNGDQVYNSIEEFLTSNLQVRGILPLELKNSAGKELVNYKIYGNSVQETLPSEYQQVEYIESAGKQYLVLDYIASGITKTTGKFQIIDTNVAGFLFGCRDGGSSNFYGFNWGGGSPYKYYNSYLHGTITTTEIDNQIHTFYKDKGNLYIDDNLIYSANEQIFTTPGNMNIFGCNNSYTQGYLPPYARIYNLQFYDNDTLMVDLIPCYRKSDNTIGMYDLVNEKFYTNAGTGVFIKGNDILYGVGDYDELTGKYKISVKVSSNLENSTTTNIYSDQPLKNGDYIDFDKQQAFINNVPIDINLPAIPTYEGTTIIEVDTEIQPSNMEVVYKGNPN